MKNLQLAFLVILALLTANAAFAQSRIGGKVIEIIDGKTVVIETFSGSRINAGLQSIEVPTAEQPFYETAKEHLQNLVLNKKVEFRARGLTQSKTVGQLFLNGVDISQQMIRDGVAWYAVLEKSGQEAAESAIYQNNEELAKNERRGIWAIKDLKPAWQIRAEAEENRRQAEKTAQAAKIIAKKTTESTPKPSKLKNRPSVMSSQSMMWTAMPETTGKMPENVSNVGGLMVGYNAQSKIGIIATPLLKLEIPDKNYIQAFGIGIGYFYRDDQSKGRESIYLVGIESDSKDFRFLKFNDLIITADNQKIVIGKASRNFRRNDFLVKELLIYQVKRTVIAKIANAKSVKIKVGNYSTSLNADAHRMLKNLLNASE